MRIILWISFFVSSLLACDNSIPETTPNEDPPSVSKFTDTVRFASYNVSMFGNNADELKSKLRNADQHINLRKLAAVIKSVAPDVLVLMEIDYDATGEVLDLLADGLLAIPLDGYDGIDYPYRYQIDSNTGQLSSVDIDGNGSISLPNDAYGFGNYSGQYASAILSKFPIDIDKQRSFKNFKWKDMPNAALPTNADGSQYYNDTVLDEFRLSSKNHIDLPITLADDVTIHALISHPTPPVFDGIEDRNGKRNHDEIRLWADYLDNSAYLMDDQGNSGGLSVDESFIIFGDLNADPIDGDSYNNAISLLLEHERVNKDITTGTLIPSSNGGAEHNQQQGDSGDPQFDTSFFGLRIDYVIPSQNLNVLSSGVFWPAAQEEAHDLVSDGGASDHLLVWADIKF